MPVDLPINALPDAVTPALTDKFPGIRAPYGPGNDVSVTWGEMVASMLARVSVLKYGAKGDGTTDDNAAIAAGAADVNQNGGCLYMPGYTTLGIKAVYRCVGEVDLPPGALHWSIEGESHGSVEIRQENDNAPVFSMVNAANVWTTARGVNALNSATVNVQDTSLFPASGTFILGGVSTTYTGKTATSFTGCGAHAATVGGERIDGTTAGPQEAGWTISGIHFNWLNQQVTTVTTQGCLSGTGTGTFTVASGGPIPSGTAVTVRVGKEQITGSISGNTFSATARAANGTTAAAHANGTTVYPVSYVDDAGKTVPGTKACGVFFPSYTARPNNANWNLTDCLFSNGSYLVGATSQTGIWGFNIRHTTADGSAVGGICNVPSTVEGQPNCNFEHIYVTANNMVGPIFNVAGGQSCWFNAIEINNSLLAPVIIRATAGSSIAVGTLKNENGVYDNSNGYGGAMFVMGNVFFEAQFMKLQGMTVDVTNMTNPCIFNRGSSGGQEWHIGTLDMSGDQGWVITNGNYFLTDSTDSAGVVYLDQLANIPARNFYLADATQTGNQDGVYLTDANRGRVSANVGDANYTWDPLGQSATATLFLSAIPNDGDTVTFAGVTYRFKVTPTQAFDVFRVATFAGNMTNLMHAVNGTGAAGTNYYAGTTPHPVVVASSPGATLTLTAIPGVGGGGYGLSVGAGNTGGLTWSGATTFSGGSSPVNILSFESALTANRTVTLPDQHTTTPSNLFNGAKVRVVRSGGGAFSLTVAPINGTSAVIASGKTGWIEYTFRRGAWILTAYSVV